MSRSLSCSIYLLPEPLFLFCLLSFLSLSLLYLQTLFCNLVSLQFLHKICFVDNILKDFMIYLKFSLQNYKETDICHKAIFSLGELILNLEEKMNVYLDETMPLILDILTKDSDKSLKVQSLLIFTNIFYCEKINSLKYFDIIIDYVTKAFDIALLSCEPNDIDLCEYYDLLRERIIECLDCIVSSILKNNKKELFKNYIESTINFINNYMKIKEEFKEDTVSELCGILCDLFQIYGNFIGSFIRNETVNKIRNILEDL